MRTQNLGRWWALVLALMLGGSVAQAYEKTTLPAQWKVQPAKSPEVAPADADWAEMGAVDWRWMGSNQNLGKGTSWAKEKKSEIHSLWYQQELTLSAAQAAGQVLLDFRQIQGDAIVFLNGERLVELQRPGGYVNLTGKAKAGKNLLRVFVTRDYTGISRGFAQDPLRYLTRGPKGRNLKTPEVGMGITAEVYLLTLPAPAALLDVFVQTSVRKKELALSLDLQAVAPAAGLAAQVEVLDAESKVVLAFTQPLAPVAAGTSVQTVRHGWETPRLWEVEAPYLYRAKVALLKDGKPFDAGYETPFGFREVWTQGRDLIVNGHPQRFRVEWSSFGITENSLPMLQMLGRNFVYIQANPSAWWTTWPETPNYSDKLFTLLDNAGIAMSIPMPGVTEIRENLLKDKQLEADYRREMQHALRRYRNHPSVLLYALSMNSFNPQDAIYPATLGQRSNYTHSQAQTLARAFEILKEYDGTRLTYGHADGNLGDVATSNFYPNWMPLQEREDYLQVWAQKGNQPFMAVEFDCVYGGDWYKGSRLLMTEYAARLLGDAAYQRETPQALAQTTALGLGNKGHGNSLLEAIPLLPVYWDVARLHVVGTDRAWRTWGGLGWHYFTFGVGYGNPPEMTSKSPFGRYDCLKQKVTGRPAWANPAFDYFAEGMQTLLAYVAGAPVHTDKTHSYFAGSPVRKQAAFVWDGAQTRNLAARWRCRAGLDGKGATLASGDFAMTLHPGDRSFAPLHFAAPAVSDRTPAVLTLEVFEQNASADKPLITDSFALEFHPAAKPLTQKARFGLFDPAGKAAEFGTLGLQAKPIKDASEVKGLDVLVVAPQALAEQTAAPFTPEDVKNGLRVVILAQQPEVWEGFGLRTIEAAARQVFLRERGAVETAGLQDADLAYWAGTPDLMPEWKYHRSPDTQHAPKATNRHNVASVALEIPDVAGFVPVLVTEFDLAYSPLLRWQYGKGAVWFCSLDLTGRLADTPPAARIADNLLRAAAEYRTATRPVYYAGDEAGRQQLAQLGAAGVALDKTNLPAGALIVAGGNSGIDAALGDQLRKGGNRIFRLAQSAAELQALGLSGQAKSFQKAALPEGPLFAAVGPDLLRSRAAADYVAVSGADVQPLAEGLFAARADGGEFFCQLDPATLLAKYPPKAQERDSALLSALRQKQLVARLLTASGATPAADYAAKTATYKPVKPQYDDLRFWQILGPFYPAAGQTMLQALGVKYPGEENAILGDTNPNLNYLTADKRTLDFRKTATAGPDGFVNLGAALNPAGECVTYAVREVESKEERAARLRIGVDYLVKVWVNGEPVYFVDGGHGAPKANQFKVNVKLKAGKNVITLKVGSGSKGNGFWASLSVPGADIAADVQGEAGQGGGTLYDAALRDFDPYEYHFW